MDAAACSLGDSIFVFAGEDSYNFCLNSVERINVPAISSGGAAWELIQLPEEVFAPRYCPTVVPLNNSEIAILGGRGDNNRKLSDVLVFNVTKKACSKVSDGSDYKF